MPDVPVTPLPQDSASEEDAVFGLPELSDQAVRFLTSAHYQESNARVKRAFGVTDDDLSFFNEMDHAVFGEMIGVDGYIRALRTEFPEWDAATRDKLIGMLVADRFLPWGDRLKPSAKAAMQEAGIALPPVSYYAVYDGPLSVEQAAAEIVKMVGIPLGGDLVQRLAAVVASRATGVRVPAQAEAQLMRPLAQGGLQLEPEQARRMVIAMGDLLGRVSLQAPAPVADTATDPLPSTPVATREAPRPVKTLTETPMPRPVAPLPPPPAVAKDVGAQQEEDAKEVAAVAARMPRGVAEAASALQEAVRGVMGMLKGVPEDPLLVRRLEQIVSTRLREVRSRNEVLTTLMRGVKVGGLGMERVAAEALTQQIEEGYASRHEGVAAAESLARDQETRVQAERVEARKAEEAAAHAAWFAEKVKGRAPAAAATASASASVPPPPVVLPGQHPLDAKEQMHEEAAFGALVPAAPKPVEGGFLAQPTVASPAVPVASVAPAPKMPASATVKVSASTATASAAAVRPRMDDVQKVAAKPSLVGPAQELAQLSLTSFRRAGRTPDTSADHVRNLVKLLAEQSFAKRIEGIRAWQSSPLQAQYVALVAEAFSSGLPMKDLLAKRRAAGQDVLTEEEVGAIVALNGELRL